MHFISLRGPYSENFLCISDPCADRTVRTYPDEEEKNCRTYWTCENGVSYPACCPHGEQFDRVTLKCEKDRHEVCRSPCPLKVGKSRNRWKGNFESHRIWQIWKRKHALIEPAHWQERKCILQQYWKHLQDITAHAARKHIYLPFVKRVFLCFLTSDFFPIVNSATEIFERQVFKRLISKPQEAQPRQTTV
jgi:hypothetical protein